MNRLTAIRAHVCAAALVTLLPLAAPRHAWAQG
jgi:hypothetical protein